MRCSILSGQLCKGTDQRLVLLSTGKERVLSCAVIIGEEEEIKLCLKDKHGARLSFCWIADNLS